MTHVSTADGFDQDVDQSPAPSADAVSLLRKISNAAAVFTADLDALSKRYPMPGRQGADPLAVVLDQAAAAANDLYSTTMAAADTIADRAANA